MFARRRVYVPLGSPQSLDLASRTDYTSTIMVMLRSKSIYIKQKKSGDKGRTCLTSRARYMLFERQEDDRVNESFVCRGRQHTTQSVEGGSSCDWLSKWMPSRMDTLKVPQPFSGGIGGILTMGQRISRMKISSREESERPCAHGDPTVSYRSEVPQKTRSTFGGVFRVTKRGSYRTRLYDVVYHFSSPSKHRPKNVACDARLDRGAAGVRAPNHVFNRGK